jgi:hypothetical protein
MQDVRHPTHSPDDDNLCDGEDALAKMWHAMVSYLIRRLIREDNADLSSDNNVVVASPYAFAHGYEL